MTIQAHPLQWPIGWKRTEPQRRIAGRFSKQSQEWNNGHSYRRTRDITLTDAVERVLAELQRMGVQRQDSVISTNVPTTLAGLPRSGARKPNDPGAAVYWTDPFNSAPRVLAIDLYTTVEHNLAAIAATLDALRAVERHGGAMILERAFTGFQALPAPGQGAKREWWEVLNVNRETVTREGAKQAYRALVSQFHTDKPGGSHDAMVELNVAYDAALAEVFR